MSIRARRSVEPRESDTFGSERDRAGRGSITALGSTAPRAVFALCLLGASQAAWAAVPVEMGMTADRWQSRGEVEFSGPRAFDGDRRRHQIINPRSVGARE